MTIYDISLTISPNLPIWPGDPALELEQIESMDKGAHANVTQISAAVHLGTHVDAPHHFLNDGRTVESFPLDVLTGPCYVTQLPDGIDAITAEVLDRTEITSDMKRVLFGTRNSHLLGKRRIQIPNGFCRHHGGRSRMAGRARHPTRWCRLSLGRTLWRFRANSHSFAKGWDRSR